MEIKILNSKLLANPCLGSLSLCCFGTVPVRALTAHVFEDIFEQIRFLNFKLYNKMLVKCLIVHHDCPISQDRRHKEETLYCFIKC